MQNLLQTVANSCRVCLWRVSLWRVHAHNAWETWQAFGCHKGSAASQHQLLWLCNKQRTGQGFLFIQRLFLPWVMVTWTTGGDIPQFEKLENSVTRIHHNARPRCGCCDFQTQCRNTNPTQIAKAMLDFITIIHNVSKLTEVCSHVLASCQSL